MADQSKRPDYSDLEPRSLYDAPEVVPESQWRGPLHRNSSTNSPQVVTPAANSAPQYDYYGSQPEVRPYYEKPPIEDREAEKQVINDNRRQKLCGMRPKVFFWVMAAVIIVLVLAAVLGGVLGTVLNRSISSSDSGSDSSQQNNSASGLPSTNSNTGLAVIIPDGTSTTYQYYQDGQGRIIENRYYDGKWLIQSDKIPSYSIIGSDAASGSPIAATTWTNSGTLFRQVFYLDENGRVMSSNTTGINDWPTPYNILPDDSALPGSKALAVIADTDTNGLNGLRVYFASSDLGIIRECGMDFGANPWTLWATFGDSDTRSGVGAVLQDTVNHVYVVNASSGHLAQWTWDYNVNLITSWKQAIKATGYVAGESDVAAVYDGISTDYIFYEGADAKLTRALSYGQTISNEVAYDAVAHGSKISVAFDASQSNNGATAFYRPENDTNEIKFETINRSGEVLQTSTVD